MLVIGGDVAIERTQRPYLTWATNFVSLVKFLVGVGGLVIALESVT